MTERRNHNSDQNWVGKSYTNCRGIIVSQRLRALLSLVHRTSMNRLKSPSAIAAIFVPNETFQSGGETIPAAIEIPPIDIGPVGILAIVCSQSELPLARPGGQGRATVSTRCGLARSPPTPSLRRSVLSRSDG